VANGIAQLAAVSPTLAAKRRVQYFDLPARSLLNRVRGMRFFDWSINPYRGCEFGCRYCYARYTHEFMELRSPEEFEDKIYAKGSPGALLRRDLRKAPREHAIAIGTATDPYQPAERRFCRTREILEVFAEDRGRRLSITTKSDLIVRDLDVLRAVARTNTLHVNMTITTLDADLARLLEPRAPHPRLRVEAVRRLAAAGLAVGVFASPALPGINDAEGDLRSVAAAAKQAGAGFFGAQPLFLSSAARRVFFPLLEERFPHLAGRYRAAYAAGMYLRGVYPERLRERVARIRADLDLASAPLAHEPETPAGHEQLVLFPPPGIQ
jgi:DNA repair photolyase